jgi:hypothetical protein
MALGTAAWRRLVTLSGLRRGASVLGDYEAVRQAVRTGSVKPLGRRLVRKALWRGFGRAMRKGGL